MTHSTPTSIAFIGAGNMASAIIGGLLKHGFSRDHIVASDIHTEAREHIQRTHGIGSLADNKEAARDVDVVILAVKPHGIEEACKEIAEVLHERTIVMSIAAGVPCKRITSALPMRQPVVRCMPNTPSMVNEGASGLFANSWTSNKQRQLATNIMSAVGTVHWVEDEALLHALTAVSGSGPAYIFLVIESMIQAGITLGLDEESARELSIQTVIGASKLAREADCDVVELRRRVTSPNGTTEQAISSFMNDDLPAIFLRAMEACAKRSKELAE